MLKVFDIPFIMHCDEFLFKKSILNLSKNPAGFFPHNLKWEKNPAGEINVWN